MSVVVVDWLGRGGIAQTTPAWTRALTDAGHEVVVVTRGGRELNGPGVRSPRDGAHALITHRRLARLAAAHGFRVVDVRLIARRSYEGLLELSTGPELEAREATETDLAFARDLAARSHRTSRFYFDGNFPRDRCDALYEEWVERGSRDPDRRLLIGVLDGNPVGYIVLTPLGPDLEGHGELVAIEERHRGKGLGRALSFAEWRAYAARGALI